MGSTDPAMANTVTNFTLTASLDNYPNAAVGQSNFTVSLYCAADTLVWERDPQSMTYQVNEGLKEQVLNVVESPACGTEFTFTYEVRRDGSLLTSPRFIPVSHISGSPFGVETYDNSEAGIYIITVKVTPTGQENAPLTLEATFSLMITADVTESASAEVECNELDFACQILQSIGSGSAETAGYIESTSNADSARSTGSSEDSKYDEPESSASSSAGNQKETKGDETGSDSIDES